MNYLPDEITRQLVTAYLLYADQPDSDAEQDFDRLVEDAAAQLKAASDEEIEEFIVSISSLAGSFLIWQAKFSKDGKSALDWWEWMSGRMEE